MIAPSQNNIGVYHFLVVIILFSLLYWVLAEKMLGFYNDVEVLTEKQSKEDFVTSISHIRNQWMGKKRAEVFAKLVGRERLSSSGEIKVLVNEQGFATKVLSVPLEQCAGLFHSLQSIDVSAVEVVQIDEQGQLIGCKYLKNNKVLFKYMFLNGIVSNG